MSWIWTRNDNSEESVIRRKYFKNGKVKCSLHDLVKLFCSMFNVVVYVNARTGSVVLSCHAQIGNGLVVYIRLSEYRLRFSGTNTYDKIPKYITDRVGPKLADDA